MTENQNYKIEISTDEKDWENGKLKVEGIKIKEDGIFLLNGSSWQITHEDLKFLGIVDMPEDYDLTDKKMYRYSNLNLPRQKVELLKDKYNLKVIRDADKADIQVVSLKFFNKIADSSWNSSYTKPQFYEICKELTKRNLLSDDAKKGIGALLQNSHSTSVFDIGAIKNWEANETVESKVCHEVIHSMKSELQNKEYSKTYVIKSSKDVDTYNKLISNSLIVLDRDINKRCCEELAILTEEDYPQLIKMITSNDIENRTLALETMANCNIEESFDIVSLIFYYEFEWCKATKNWNTVNVKSFKNRFSDMNSYGSQTAGLHHSTLIRWLYDENYLTRFAVDNIKERIHTKVLKAAGINIDNTVFKVALEAIKMADKYEESIIEKNVDK